MSKCPKFVSPDEKIKELRRKNYCTKCSRKNHETRSCNAKLKCNICEGNHYPYLYTTKNISTAFVSVKKKQGALITKEIISVNPVTKETAETVVIFDSGSQQSYISNKLIDKLKLENIQKEKVHIIGFGGKKSSYNSSLVKFQIKTIDGCKEIFANSTKNITATVPVTEMVEDISTVYKTPDILIGMDYFFDIINSFEKHDDNLFVINSTVGRMYCQNTPKLNKVTVTSLANQALQRVDKVKIKLQKFNDTKWREVQDQTKDEDKVHYESDTQNILKSAGIFHTKKKQLPLTNDLADQLKLDVIQQIPKIDNGMSSSRGSSNNAEFQRQNKYVRPPSLTTVSDVIDKTSNGCFGERLEKHFKKCGKLLNNSKKSWYKNEVKENLVSSATDEYKYKFISDPQKVFQTSWKERPP
uniref:Peptidase aspartic putative domain-containing protein n=1 Tax=Panagrolaimus davidi TaxID=227884 RepID=A0A914QCW9_9BILA